MQTRLDGKTAVITGAASGVGFAIAQAMSEAGASIVLADLDGDSGERAREAIARAPAASRFVKTNVADVDAVRRLMDTAVEHFGAVDILVNNAGLQFLSPVVEFPEERWNLLVDVILTGTFLCSKYALPHMLRRKWGRVINIASLHAKVASPFKSAYVAAKHGVLGFTKTLALEVAEHNITCNAICPAYVRTPLVEKQIAEQAMRHGIAADEVVSKIMTEPAAIKRLLEPSEVAALAVYLTSDLAAGITGAALDIDLGWTAR
ncbi:MAG: 3-hydroxybutyrate dehydrogenase [Acidobacteriaceae bacterium]|nr:3-hydroxybutyrate dehydrogenase [Acidobacteriaceae bacterium]